MQTTMDRNNSECRGWDEITFGVTETDAYALEVSGNSLAPVYRDGDVLIVSPSAELLPGCRVIVRALDGTVEARQLLSIDGEAVTLAPLTGGNPETFDLSGIDWVSRIVWASQ